MTENLIDLFLVLFLFMMTQNSTGTGCQQWSLLSAALSSPLASAGPLVSALAVYLWWKLVRRMTAWKFRWQRRSVKFRLDDTLLVLLLHCLSTRRKKKKRWKTVENTPFLDLSIPFASDSVFWFIPPPPPSPTEVQLSLVHFSTDLFPFPPLTIPCFITYHYHLYCLY